METSGNKNVNSFGSELMCKLYGCILFTYYVYFCRNCIMSAIFCSLRMYDQATPNPWLREVLYFGSLISKKRARAVNAFNPFWNYIVYHLVCLGLERKVQFRRK